MAFSTLLPRISSPLTNLTSTAMAVSVKRAPMRLVCGISSQRLLQNWENRRPVSTRCYSSSTSSRSSILDPLVAELKILHSDVSPSVVALRSFFSAPKNGQLLHCSRAGAGVFVDRALIVTSAHVVGKISTDRGSGIHSCRNGRNFAVTIGNEVVRTKILAVDFAGDVAVLEAEGDLPPPCTVARSVASKELPLMVITKHESCNGGGHIQMKARAMEDNSSRSDWPYKLEDGLGWVRYGGGPFDEVKIAPGSPWFSIDRQMVGTASWAAGDEAAAAVASAFVVPPLRIKSVVDYAKRKGPRDPIVLDRWISGVTFADYD